MNGKGSLRECLTYLAGAVVAIVLSLLVLWLAAGCSAAVNDQAYRKEGMELTVEKHDNTTGRQLTITRTVDGYVVERQARP